MAKEYAAKGFDELIELIDSLSKNEQINVYFSGSKDSSGKSWCPDCVLAEPHVMSAKKWADKNSAFVYVDVGDRSFWKNINNPFRIHKDISLSVIPTLIRWKGPQRLEGDQLENDDLLEMFFTD